MAVAYIINHYPTVSHSFIRREIAGLEAAGVTVRRFTLRPPPADLPDPDDQAEAKRTEVVLAQGATRLLLACAVAFLTQPGRAIGALRIAWAMSRRTPRARLRHLAYFAEACWLSGRMTEVRHIHAHFGTNSTAVARLVHKLTTIPYSFTAHGPEEFDSPLALDLPGKVADARFVAAISEFGRSQLMRWTPPAQWSKLQVVRCGVDELFTADAPLAQVEAPRLCCVARLSAQKGLPLLLAAASLLKDRGTVFELRLVGDGELRGEIEADIARRGLGEQVVITGYVAAAQVREEIETSRAMVLPSFAEGLPVVIMEAMALRVPVIATAIAGVPELVDASCGWLIPPGAIEPLADAMRAAILAEPEKLRAMGTSGRARVLAQHDAADNARLLAVLIKD